MNIRCPRFLTYMLNLEFFKILKSVSKYDWILLIYIYMRMLTAVTNDNLIIENVVDCSLVGNIEVDSSCINRTELPVENMVNIVCNNNLPSIIGQQVSFRWLKLILIMFRIRLTRVIVLIEFWYYLIGLHQFSRWIK